MAQTRCWSSRTTRCSARRFTPNSRGSPEACLRTAGTGVHRSFDRQPAAADVTVRLGPLPWRFLLGALLRRASPSHAAPNRERSTIEREAGDAFGGKLLHGSCLWLFPTLQQG